MRVRIPARVLLLAAAVPAALLAAAAGGQTQPPQGLVYPGAAGRAVGGADPAFSQPSLVPGVDYTLPSRAGIKAVLDRIREHYERSTSYRVIDTATGEVIEDLSRPLKTAGIDNRSGEFTDWTYSNGVALAGMLHVADVTGDLRYRTHTLRVFDFIHDHIDYFRRQAREFGPQRDGYRRLLDMRELDDCGAIGAALVKAYEKKRDARYRETIDVVAEFITRRMSRMADGTIARTRPWPVSIWVDDLYMSVPFLAQMGRLTGDRSYYDDAARQVIQFSARLFDDRRGLYDHSWFDGMDPDPRFYWGRGAGWALMATAELLSVMPEDHPRRGAVLDIFRKAAQGVASVQGGTGLWHQLLDRTDSYLESSASAMFTFALARGVNRGWLPPTYAPVAQAGWRALETRVLADGRIDGICVGTTAASDAAYYYNRPTDIAAAQGYGATLMAGAEMILMVEGFDVERINNTFYYRPRKKS
ncbi:MAG: glycoside hydrolase family 105 protein [Vicinamibacterales bacterium]